MIDANLYLLNFNVKQKRGTAVKYKKILVMLLLCHCLDTGIGHVNPGDYFAGGKL